MCFAFSWTVRAQRGNPFCDCVQPEHISYLDQIIAFLQRRGPSSLSVVAGAKHIPKGAGHPTDALSDKDLDVALPHAVPVADPETFVSRTPSCPAPHAMQDRSVLVSAEPFAVDIDGDGDVDVRFSKLHQFA